jgi:hypothetical protein
MQLTNRVLICSIQVVCIARFSIIADGLACTEGHILNPGQIRICLLLVILYVTDYYHYHCHYH